MDAKTAKAKANEVFLKFDDILIEEYTQLINNRILESINKGRSYYGNYSAGIIPEHKYSTISNIVEAKFEKVGYRFRKGTYANYFRWDDDLM